MGKILIIAEKPSLCKNIIAAIKPAMKWHAGSAQMTGWYENDKYVASYAFGHLLELKDGKDYDDALEKWDDSVLPIVPPGKKFAYKVKESKTSNAPKAQLDVLKKLIARADVEAIANAGDSDREGEIIVRNILNCAKNKKPVYRLWLPDQTEKTISSALTSMKKDSEYDNLAEEGYARTYADWLYGVNLTRLATVRCGGKLLRVGRVTTPIIVAICERERAIRNFVPEKYFVAVHDVDGLKLESKEKFKSQGECLKLCRTYNALPTVVSSRTATKKTISRPKLLALSDLQGIAGKTLKLTPKETLDALQKLYEAGYTSYPRTDSQYMAVAEKGKAKDILDAIHKAFPGKYDGAGFRDSKDIFDDSKIEAHSAITPTYKIPDPASLPPEQKGVYGIVINRFCAVFCKEEYTINRTTLTITNGTETFKINGDVLLTKGWTMFEPAAAKKDTAALLPPLKENDKITPHFVPVEKETAPPEHYTADSLNKYLKNPYSKEEQKDITDEADDEVITKEVVSEVELGTEATRAGLIDNAIRSGYITLDKNRYGITDLGEYYCDTLEKLGINMTKDRTLNLSKSLKLVYKKKKLCSEIVDEAIGDLKAIVAGAAKDIPKASNTGSYSGSGSSSPADSKDILGPCPVCKTGQIVEREKLFGCTTRGCKCTLWKDNKYFAAFQHKMTKSMAKSFITKGYADVDGLVSSRTGKSFSSRVNVTWSTPYPTFDLDFNGYSGKKATKK